MRGLFRFLVWMSIFAGILLGALWAAGIRTKRIPTADPVFTSSLKPSLNEGDLIVTQSIMKPVYGDLVLCPEPGAEERYIIGRVFGEPGDNVKIKNGLPIVNGEPFTREYACNEPKFRYPNPDSEGETVEQQCDWEVIANRLHKVGLPFNLGRQEHRDFEVPEEHYFLVSDNRQYPYDSRDFGPAPIDSCQTTVLARLWSKDGWLDSPNRLNYIH